MKKLFSLLLLIVGMSAAGSVAHAETVQLKLNQPQCVSEYLQGNQGWILDANFGQSFYNSYSFDGFPTDPIKVNIGDILTIQMVQVKDYGQATTVIDPNSSQSTIYSFVALPGTTDLQLFDHYTGGQGQSMTYEYLAPSQAGTAILRVGLQGIAGLDNNPVIPGMNPLPSNFYYDRVLDKTITIIVADPTAQHTAGAQ